MGPVRVYADTLVFGGVEDAEFRTASERFFSEVEAGQLVLVTSALVQAELAGAPPSVKSRFEALLPIAEVVDVTADSLALRDAYLRAGIVTQKYATDALHVALATASECAVIVSWNFRHIVHFRKIPLYNAINTLEGYSPVAIYSPLEVVRYDEDI